MQMEKVGVFPTETWMQIANEADATTVLSLSKCSWSLYHACRPKIYRCLILRNQMQIGKLLATLAAHPHYSHSTETLVFRTPVDESCSAEIMRRCPPSKRIVLAAGSTTQVLGNRIMLTVPSRPLEILRIGRSNFFPFFDFTHVKSVYFSFVEPIVCPGSDGLRLGVPSLWHVLEKTGGLERLVVTIHGLADAAELLWSLVSSGLRVELVTLLSTDKDLSGLIGAFPKLAESDIYEVLYLDFIIQAELWTGVTHGTVGIDGTLITSASAVVCYRHLKLALNVDILAKARAVGMGIEGIQPTKPSSSRSERLMTQILSMSFV